MKLTGKTILPNQIVTVIDSKYKLSTLSKASWYTPSTKLIGYKDIGWIHTPTCELDIGEQLEIINFDKSNRTVKYKRLSDGKVYSSYLGEFTAFVRLLNKEKGMEETT